MQQLVFVPSDGAERRGRAYQLRGAAAHPPALHARQERASRLPPLEASTDRPRPTGHYVRFLLTSTQQTRNSCTVLSTLTRTLIRYPCYDLGLARPATAAAPIRFYEGLRAYRDDIVHYIISILACVAVMFRGYNAARAYSEGIQAILRLRGTWATVTSTYPSVQFSVDRVNFLSALATTKWEPMYLSSIWGSTVFPPDVVQMYESLGMLRPETLFPVKATGSACIHRRQHMPKNEHRLEDPCITPDNDGADYEQLVQTLSNIIELDRKHGAMAAAFAAGGPVNHDDLQDAPHKENRTCFRLRVPLDQGQYFDEYQNDRDLRGELLSARENSLSGGRGHDGTLAVFGHEARLEIWLLLVLQMSDTSGKEHHGHRQALRSHDSHGSDGANSTANEAVQGEAFMLKAWRRLVTYRGLDWTELRTLAKQVMWMDAFHDHIGREAFEALPQSAAAGKAADGYSRTSR
ncbi:hypothetical protein Micbo1qcDRAFT_226542 [Microdochium bolleyi]|uniref:Uncharacterized protein n=1 Tax=Microdochium bolleyi TaxID=196109 RepID=A0A136IZZ7_9PEZI|nr:hypothetical protein Micbo1qcDRAFT_226542 [Microdochium bolleyi]